jgi:flagellar motor protein MotB
VEVTNEGNVLRIPDETLSFEKGSYVIPPEKRQKADLIGAALLKELQRPENLRLLDTIFIEGHTDSVPNNREMGNWGLSTYRAIALWNSWTDKQGSFQALRDLKNARGEPLFSVSGYSDTRRVVEPSAEALKALESPKIAPGAFKELDEPKNRRIDLRFAIRGSEEVRQKLEEELFELEGLQSPVLERSKKP